MDKVAWVLIRDGKLLVARNRGRDLFYLPGGKPEPEESHADTLVREALEELRVRILPGTMRLVADITAPCDGAAGFVQMSCYAAQHRGHPVPASEIAQLGWFTRADYGRVTTAEQQVMDLLVLQGRMTG